MTNQTNEPQTPEEENNTESTVMEPDAVVGDGLANTTDTAASSGNQTKSSLFDDEDADRIVDLEDLEDEDEYSEEDMKNYVNLYEGTISDFVEGEVVNGKVIAIGSKEVSVDIGFKSEGVIPIDEFADPKSLEIGQDIEVFLDNVEDSDGQLVLSRKKAEFMRDWERVVRSYENGDVLEGRCMRRIKGGIVVDLNGVDAFLPGSQIDVRPIRDFDAFIGRTLTFRIVKVNELRKNIVVSHRVLVEEQLVGQRKKILDNLEKGQILEGSVKNITDFGVFIDLGGVDGLLHINDLSWGRVGHPSEIVSLDEKIKVQVLDFNEAKDRISLGYKQLQPHPWVNVEEKYPVGSVITGKVVSISDYGAFIELEKGVEGLIHISEMSWTQHIRHPSKLLNVGESVEAKVLNLDVEDRKISLGLKQLEPDPWEQIEEKFPVNSQQKGIVRNLTAFGAFIELEEGIDGLVHISDLSWTKKIRHPGEVLKKGDEVEVIVLNLDKANRRISLGYKQTMDNPWHEFESTYGSGQTTTGKIVRMIDKGVIAELPDGVDGFVPISHLTKENLNKPSDGYAVGDTLDLVVIEFNKENKKIILSERLAKPSEEEQKDEPPAEEAASEASTEPAPAEEAASEASTEPAPAEEASESASAEEAADEAKDDAEEKAQPEAKSADAEPASEEDEAEQQAEAEADEKEAPSDAADADESDKGEPDKGESNKDESDKDESDKDESDKDESDKDESDKDESDKDESDKDESDKDESKEK